MVDFSHFSITEPLGSGYDFYTADAAINISASFSASLSLNNVSVSKTSSFSLSIQNVLSVNLSAVFERQQAIVQMSASATVTASMYKISHADSVLSVASGGQSNATKIAVSQSVLSGNLTLSAQAIEILLGVSAVSSSLSLSVNSVKIARASASIQNILSTSLTAVFERHDGSVSMSGNLGVLVQMTKIAHAELGLGVAVSGSELQISITKEAHAQSNISGHIDVANTPVIKTAKANSAISGSLSSNVILGKISFITAAMSSHVDLSVLGKIVLITIRINMLNNLTVTPRIIKYRPSVSGVEILDAQQIRTLLSIDNRVITNHNRSIESSIEPIFVENTNVKNTTSRYYKSTTRASRNIFVLSWAYLPNSKEQTVDDRWARDYILSIAKDPDYHVLKITNMDSSGVTPDTQTSYNVLVTDYSETLVRRDIDSNTYYWDCSITLGEV